MEMELVWAGFDFAIDLGITSVEIEDRELPIIAIIEKTTWEEKHPLYGTYNCPEPGFIEYEGDRLTELWLAEDVTYSVKEDEKKQCAYQKGKYYKPKLEITNIFTDNEWEYIEKHVNF